ncbi:MAG: 3-dehydroquinate synthase family protein [Bacteroidales bacterium]
METVQDDQCVITIGLGSLEKIDEFLLKYFGSNIAVLLLVDKHSCAYTLPVLQKQGAWVNSAFLLEVDGTESSKQIETLCDLWKRWAELGVDRRAIVINLGGGALCDMGGLAASLYKRGLPFIQIPTTLLSMVDASVGGKTAVNLGELKNALGLFVRPQAVFISPEFLKTLDLKEYLSGIAEIIKICMIRRKDFSVEGTNSFFCIDTLPESIINYAVKQKAEVVGMDFKEEGIRKILNFGHTFGHAFESHALLVGHPIPHGWAVAYGLLCELYLSMQCKGFPKTEFRLVCRCISKHYGQYYYDNHDIKKLVAYMRNDKKNKNAAIYPVLLSSYACCFYDEPVSEDSIIETLQAYPKFDMI